MSVLVCEGISSTTDNQIKNFSYNFLDNQIYGFVGKNDSKISDFFDLISGNIKPTEGKIYIDGEDLYDNDLSIYERVFYLPTAPKYFYTSPIIKIIGKLSEEYPKWDNTYFYQLLRDFNIDINAFFGKITKREQSIVLGCFALASKANITIMNLPLKDADIKDKYDFFKAVYQDHEIYHRTILVNTDYIDDITYLVDKVLFFDKGRLFAQFTIDEINENFRYISGKTEVLKSLMNGVKVIGYEDLGKTLTVCVRQKLSKDDIRKYQKYMIKITDVPIHCVFVYLINLREIKIKF